MSGDDAGLGSRALELRREFDAAFAAAPAGERGAADDYLAIRVGGDPHAIPLADVAGLHKDRRIVPISGRSGTFLGVAGFRGEIAAVYDLAALLGYGAPVSPRWLVLARTTSPIALAFDHLEAHVRVARSEVSSAATASVEGRFLRGSIHVNGVHRPLLHIASLLEAVARPKEP